MPPGHTYEENDYWLAVTLLGGKFVPYSKKIIENTLEADGIDTSDYYWLKLPNGVHCIDNREIPTVTKCWFDPRNNVEQALMCVRRVGELGLYETFLNHMTDILYYPGASVDAKLWVMKILLATPQQWIEAILRMKTEIEDLINS